MKRLTALILTAALLLLALAACAESSGGKEREDRPAGPDGKYVAVVRWGQNWGVVDSNGEWVVEPKFAYMHQYSQNGLAYASIIQDGTKLLEGFVDTSGNWVIPPQFEQNTAFTDAGIAGVYGVCEWPYEAALYQQSGYRQRGKYGHGAAPDRKGRRSHPDGPDV